MRASPPRLLAGRELSVTKTPLNCPFLSFYLASIEAILVRLTVAIRFLDRRDAGFFRVSFLRYQWVNSYGAARRIFTAAFDETETLSMGNNRCTLSAQTHKL
jgi:hypothetical protein